MKKFVFKSTAPLYFVLLLLIASRVFAADLSALKSDETFIYPDYYMIKDDPRLENINLLNMVHTLEKFPYPTVPYNRDTQFGGWLRESGSTSCLNTRGKVLVRDSESPVSFTPNGCTVDTGAWNDSYTAKVFSSAHDIQIDHLVPLKNAYMTGAFEWDFKKRCLYANFLGNNFHLLSVFGKENMKKSDSSPSGYIPPNKNFTCQYLKIWLNVKIIWSLRLTPKEVAAVQNIAVDNDCNTEDFMIPYSQVQTQRDFMQAHANLCEGVVTGNASGQTLEAF
jgi:hypothetical protein